MSKRKNHSREFKSCVALEALKGEQTVSELASQFGVQPTMIDGWNRVLAYHFAQARVKDAVIASGFCRRYAAARK